MALVVRDPREQDLEEAVRVMNRPLVVEEERINFDEDDEDA